MEALVSAEYLGDASGRFENTTPLAAYCQRWSADCREMRAMQLPITYDRTTIKNSGDVRDHFYVQLPSARTVDVFNSTTGESHRLNFEFLGVSQQVQGTPELRVNPVWTYYVRGGCSYRQTFGYASRPYATHYLWLVRDPKSPAGCYSIHDAMSTGYTVKTSVSNMGIAYRLTMPEPSRMKPGFYTGSLTYSIGPGGDFDFGNGVSAINGNSLTLNFELDVQHAFVFEFPPGSDRAVLEPPGGWSAWLGGRGAPQRLQRDVPFRLWSTGPFKVYKLCQPYQGSGCAIRSSDNHSVPVAIALSLPGGIQHQGKPVQRLELPTGPCRGIGVRIGDTGTQPPRAVAFHGGPRGCQGHAGPPRQPL
ncbi:hypothetical protein [Pseudomonas asiatica]|uniref:hypothetical protein n=1 Tax=Pseudomonas asiatica TaxID=2219225 RepID=UPI0023669321|nr:hypothetical protein [Pseudomonas asiatica]MDD1984126.1 hypothetical protein [Pseudomonas asiatica]